MRVDLDELERCGTDEEREDPMICVLCNVEVHDINCGLGGDMYEAPMLCCECICIIPELGLLLMEFCQMAF